MSILIVIEIDEDGATVTRFNQVARILPTIEDDDLTRFVGGGVTVERTLSTTSAAVAALVQEAVRGALKGERGSPPRPDPPGGGGSPLTGGN